VRREERWPAPRRPAPARRARVGPRAALGAALCAALLLLAAPGAAHGARRSRHGTGRHRPALIPVSVAVDRGHPGAPVPRDFLGLSFEVSSLPQIASYAASGDLVELLRSLGPGVLRFGGVTADFETGGGEAPGGRPAWAWNVLDGRDLGELAGLAAATGWRVLLTIGLGHYEPEAAAREAATAKALLGGSLAGIELGNEPNAYAQHGLREEPRTVRPHDPQVT